MALIEMLFLRQVSLYQLPILQVDQMWPSSADCGSLLVRTPAWYKWLRVTFFLLLHSLSYLFDLSPDLSVNLERGCQLDC